MKYFSKNYCKVSILPEGVSVKETKLKLIIAQSEQNEVHRCYTTNSKSVCRLSDPISVSDADPISEEVKCMKYVMAFILSDPISELTPMFWQQYRIPVTHRAILFVRVLYVYPNYLCTRRTAILSLFCSLVRLSSWANRNSIWYRLSSSGTDIR